MRQGNRFSDLRIVTGQHRDGSRKSLHVDATIRRLKRLLLQALSMRRLFTGRHVFVAGRAVEKGRHAARAERAGMSGGRLEASHCRPSWLGRRPAVARVRVR